MGSDPWAEVVLDVPSLDTSTPLNDVVLPIDDVDVEPVTELLLPPDPNAVDDADDVLEPDTVLPVVIVDPDELNVVPVAVLPVPADDVIVELVDPREELLDAEEVNVVKEVDVVERVDGESDPVTVIVWEEPIDVVAANIFIKMYRYKFRAVTGMCSSSCRWCSPLLGIGQ